jgi:hypothetical protein
MIIGVGCPIAPIVNRHTIKVAGKLTGPDKINVAIMLDKELADYCSSLYHSLLVKTLPLPSYINVSHIANKAFWHRLRRFDLDGHFERGDKLLFLDLDAYVTGIEVDAMFDLVSDQDGSRLLMASDLLATYATDTSVMLLSYQPNDFNDFNDLMETYRRLQAQGVEMRSDRELFAWHAQARGEKYTLPGSMTVLIAQMHMNIENRTDLLVHPGNSTIPLVRVLRFGDEMLFRCQGVQRYYEMHAKEYVPALSRAISWICCTGNLVARTFKDSAHAVSLFSTSG